MHLKAICCFGVGTHHHSCVVDQNVEMLFLCREEEKESARGQPRLLHLRNRPHTHALKRGMHGFNLSSIFPSYLFCIVFHFKMLVESYIFLLQGKIPHDMTKWPFQSFQFRTYWLTAFGKCSISPNRKTSSAEWEIPKQEKNRMFGMPPCHSVSGPQRNTGFTSVSIANSLMISFFISFVIFV